MCVGGCVCSGVCDSHLDKCNVHSYMYLVGKPERKKQLGRSERRYGDMLKCILMKCDGRLWIGFLCLRIESSCRLLYIR